MTEKISRVIELGQKSWQEIHNRRAVKVVYEKELGTAAANLNFIIEGFLLKYDERRQQHICWVTKVISQGLASHLQVGDQIWVNEGEIRRKGK